MVTNSHPTPAPDSWVVHFLVVGVLLQTLVVGCSLWAIGILLAAAQSELLRDLVTVCSAVATAVLRVGLHLLGI